MKKEKDVYAADLIRYYKDLLRQHTLGELKTILSEHDKWFSTFDVYETDFETIKKRKKLRLKKEIVNWIGNTDPIMAEGGLMDFLDFIKTKGFLREL